MVVSDIEKQRLLNIERNKQLLKQLSLDKINEDIKNQVKEEKNKKKERATVKRKKKASINVEPIRKSRRLQGVKVEDTDEYKLAMAVSKGSNNHDSKSGRGNIQLDDNFNIINGKGIGVRKRLPVNANLINEVEANNNGIKKEYDDADLLRRFNRIIDEFDADNHIFTNAIKHETNSDEQKDFKSIEEMRDSINNLEIYDKFPANKIALTDDRMSFVRFHPTNKEKVIIGGDILGNLGIWNPNNDNVEAQVPSITKFQLHNKHITKVSFQYNNSNNMYTSSYDNSIRVTDLKTLKSTELISVKDEDNNEDIGISDMQISTTGNQDQKFSNLIFYTTLTGHFAYFDIRSPPKSHNTWNDLRRMSDKKIGGFSIYPLNNHLISTASLDRTLKVWDIRNLESSSVWSEKFPEDGSFELNGIFQSRLSISVSDWNSSGDIVCNGYANQIYILNDVNEVLKTLNNNKKMKANSVIKHNCKTGKWVSILKARWQTNGKDGYEKFVIGNLDRKSFDIYSRNGVLVSRLTDTNLMTAVPAVANFHPTENWLIGGTAKGKVVMYS